MRKLDFNVNAPVLYVLAGIIVLVVLAQSGFFLTKAWKRGLELGMNKERLRRVVTTSAVFTVAPAVAIVISVITLAKDLGVPLPWLRLSVVGSLSYETIAAANAESAMGLVFGQVTSLTASQYATIVCVMTLSIMVGIWLVPVVCKRVQGGMASLETRDKKWADVFSNAMFIGMISAFLGYVFCDVSTVLEGSFAGLIPVCVMLVSAVCVVICSMVHKVFKKAWILDYALPVSLILSMLSAIPITAWLG
ncbi:MAG: DUF5058 family protein [Clostridiales bacterium]|nr:DUF5058 family protein [Clostridiales bacterium]